MADQQPVRYSLLRFLAPKCPEPGSQVGLSLELEVRQSGQAGGGGAAILGLCVDEQAKKADLQSKAGKWSSESSRDATQCGIKAGGKQVGRAVRRVLGASQLWRAPMFLGEGRSHEAPFHPHDKPLPTTPFQKLSLNAFFLGSPIILPKS